MARRSFQIGAWTGSKVRAASFKSLISRIVFLHIIAVAVVAIFLLLTYIGNLVPVLGIGSQLGLILVYLGGALGVNTYLMYGFFNTIPTSLDEAAKRESVMSVVRGAFKPEFLNRLDDIVLFDALSNDELTSIVDLQIKPEAVDPEDVETLQDLILAAYRDAHTQAGKLAEEKIAPLTGGAAGGQPGGAPQAGPGDIPFGGII